MKLTSIDGSLFVRIRVGGRDQTLPPGEAIVTLRSAISQALNDRDSAALARGNARAAMGDALLTGAGSEQAKRDLAAANDMHVKATARLAELEGTLANLRNALAGNSAASITSQARARIDARLQPFNLEQFA